VLLALIFAAKTRVSLIMMRKADWLISHVGNGVYFLYRTPRNTIADNFAKCKTEKSTEVTVLQLHERAAILM
jgi:hypothetical protein